MILRITKKTLGKNRHGWVYDRRSGLWITYAVDLTLGRHRIRRRGFRTRREAEQFELDLRNRHRQSEFDITPPKAFPLVSDLFARRIEAGFANRKEHVRAERVFRLFLQILGHGTRINRVSRSHYREYCDRRIADGVSPATAAREITVIAAAFNRAAEFWPELENFTPVRPVWPKVPKKSRGRVIRRDERIRLVNHLLRPAQADESGKTVAARHRAGLLLQFALLTGLRHGEICLLRKNWLDRSRSTIRVERPKTDSDGEIVLSASALDVLTRAAGLFPDSPFFFSRNGKPHYAIYRILSNACSEIGLDYGRRNGGFVIHDARHTFITALQAAGFDLATISSFSGHSDAHIVSRYTHATPESQKRAAIAISEEMDPSIDPSLQTNASSEPAVSDPDELFRRIRSGELALEEFRRLFQK